MRKRQSLILAAVMAALTGGLVSVVASEPASAGDGLRKARLAAQQRRGTRVKGFVARAGGGYSYSYAQSINTYGDSRGRYGSTTTFRDQGFSMQTDGGPFDNGFFFSSGIGSPHGGDSPYMH